jgi:hypothetical protein
VTSLPLARGPLSSSVRDALASGAPLGAVAPADRGDAAVALWMLHELDYRGFDGVDDDPDPALLAVRRSLEDALVSGLRTTWPRAPEVDLVGGFFDWVAAFEGPSVAAHVQRHATRAQVDRLLRVRAVYHLKEADPTTWVVPRLRGAAQAALVELQYDEYGAGRPARVHQRLYARGLEASGLAADLAAYVDEAPVEVLEQNNALSTFGLRRSLRGAAVGHLAAFEATSSLPSRRMAQGLERLGYPAELVGYYTEHVEADAVHEQVALRDVCAALVADEPGLEDDVWFGAWACLELERRTAERLLGEWDREAAA